MGRILWVTHDGVFHADEVVGFNPLTNGADIVGSLDPRLRDKP